VEGLESHPMKKLNLRGKSY